MKDLKKLLVNVLDNEIFQSFIVFLLTLFVFFLTATYANEESGKTNYLVLGIIVGLFNILLFQLNLNGFSIAILTTVATTSLSYVYFPDIDLTVVMTATTMIVGLITLIILFTKDYLQKKQN